MWHQRTWGWTDGREVCVDRQPGASHRVFTRSSKRPANFQHHCQNQCAATSARLQSPWNVNCQIPTMTIRHTVAYSAAVSSLTAALADWQSPTIYRVSQKILHPWSFFKIYVSKTENFKAKFYTHIWRLSLRQTAKFHSIISKYDEVMPCYALSPRELFIFTSRILQNTNFWYLTTNKWFKCTNCQDITATKTANGVQ